jgi:hypothetical protein
MDDFLEFEKNRKSIKSLNLDDFSIEDLSKYISELKIRIKRVVRETEKKMKIIDQAKKIFNLIKLSGL